MFFFLTKKLNNKCKKKSFLNIKFFVDKTACLISMFLCFALVVYFRLLSPIGEEAKKGRTVHTSDDGS